MKKQLIYTCVAVIIGVTTCALHPRNDSGSQTSLVPKIEKVNPDSLIKVASLKSEKDYTIPSFTRLRMAVVAVENDSARADELAFALDNLVPAGMPFSITVSIKGDPTERMAFNWLTEIGRAHV